MKKKKTAKKTFKSIRFAGVSLTGGKTDKTSVAVIEYFPSEKKIFLSYLYDNIKSDKQKSADQSLFELLNDTHKSVKHIAIDAPLTPPKCMRCRLKCPGYEVCKEPEIKWLRSLYKKKNKQKNPKKIFTPYTERCVETYISTELEEPFIRSHAMGANMAPLYARAHFLARRLGKKNFIEVYPKLSLWRMGRSLNIQKSYLRHHKHAVDGENIREVLLEKLSEKNVAFLYDQDRKIMIKHKHAFDAFICAMTALFNELDLCESPPQGFPEDEPWIYFPQKKLTWGFIS
ncbi:MAG: DUF429 domain-containing protein [Bdellovibrionales bacterium]|nr:DUF429 domain-containing protein [Bdellovibrionales bacterium]